MTTRPVGIPDPMPNVYIGQDFATGEDYTAFTRLTVTTSVVNKVAKSKIGKRTVCVRLNDDINIHDVSFK